MILLFVFLKSFHQWDIIFMLIQYCHFIAINSYVRILLITNRPLREYYWFFNTQYRKQLYKKKKEKKAN